MDADIEGDETEEEEEGDEYYDNGDDDDDVQISQRKILTPSAVDPQLPPNPVQQEAEEELAPPPTEPLLQVAYGYPSHGHQPHSRLVRVFTSSTFTDTKQERNALMERVYPALKSFCHQLGYHFQVVDMRWGVRDEATNDHRTNELCLKEIVTCQKLSTGPSFITMLSHKYGYRPLPRLIEKEEFLTVTQDSDESGKQLLHDWYLLDQNAVPPSYVLQPISSVCPDYLSHDKDQRKAAKEVWWQVYNTLQDILSFGATKYLRDEAAMSKYIVAVTEQEIDLGIVKAKDPGSHCLWFKRNITDIDQVSKIKLLDRYKEQLSSDMNNQELTQVNNLMKNLKENKIPSVLPNENTINYDIHWSDQGVHPDNAEHKVYLDQLCKDFEDKTKKLINKAISSKEYKYFEDPVYQDILIQSLFAKQKSETFHGRKTALMLLHEYMIKDTGRPLIVFGQTGCGKTSLMAEVSCQAWKWMKGNGVIISRFIGTTEMSCAIRPLLIGLLTQLADAYGQSKEKLDDKDTKVLNELLESRIKSFPTTEKPLLLLIDSLDQIDSADGGRQLDWLPRELPGHLKIIVSTLPDVKYGCLQRLKSMVRKSSCYIGIGNMCRQDMEGVLDKWLHNSKRTLTDEQRLMLLAAFINCPTPLFLKLHFDQAQQWYSYDKISDSHLQSNVSEAIEALFRRLEVAHGAVLVKYALVYLTLTQHGLAEEELEDLLSLSDEVLNDVYQYWEPPARRLPPLLWVRIKNELDEYLVSRNVDGMQVISWSGTCRQFSEVVSRCYLSDKIFLRRCHKDIAEYFQGEWANKPKPYTNKKNEELSAMRFVAEQPIKFNMGKYNKRKLRMLPYHLICAGQIQTLKKDVLCNYEFLRAKIAAVDVSSVFHDLKLAKIAYPQDEDIPLLMETLQLSAEALATDPNALAGQLVGRIYDYAQSAEKVVKEANDMIRDGYVKKEMIPTIQMLTEKLDTMLGMVNKKDSIHSLLDQAISSPQPVLVPHMGFLVPPGRQLVHQMAGHMGKVHDMSVSPDGKVAATAGADETIKLWSVTSGELRHDIKLKQPAHYLAYFPSGSYLVASCGLKKLYVIDTQQGTVVNEIDNSGGGDLRAKPVTVYKPKKGHVIIICVRARHLDFLDSNTGDVISSPNDGIEDRLKSFHYNEKKHLTCSGSLVVYANYLGDSVFFALLDNLKSVKIRKVQLFESEPEPNQAESMDHIGSLGILPKDKSYNVIISNGKSRELHLFKVEKNIQPLMLLQGDSQVSISGMFYASDEAKLYCWSNQHVGQIDMDQSTKWDQILQHPCNVQKVQCVNKRYVITLAEDNILRIWDKSLNPFKPDLSAFTGQIQVNTEKQKDSYNKLMDGILSDIQDNKPSVDDLITTNETNNYWSKMNSPHSDDVTITTRFLLMANPRYIAVCQDHKPTKGRRQWTVCISIWDVIHVRCVRRMFLPGEAAFAYEIMHNNQLVLAKFTSGLCELNHLDVVNWKVLMKASNQLHHSRTTRPIVAKHHKEHIIVIASARDCACVIDGETGRYRDLLNVPSATLSWHAVNVNAGRPDFSDIIMSDKYIIALWGNVVVVVWDAVTLQQVCEIRLTDHVPGLADQLRAVTLCPVLHETLLVVTIDDPQTAMGKGKDSAVILDLSQGTCVCHIDDKASTEPSGGAHTMVLLRKYSNRQLELMAVSADGSGRSLHRESVGAYDDCLRITEDGQHCVVFSSDPRERTLLYYGIQGDRLVRLGSFTPDEHVTDVAFVAGGSTSPDLIINSSPGLVKLMLRGGKVKTQSTEQIFPEVLFEDVKLEIPYDLTYTPE